MTMDDSDNDVDIESEELANNQECSVEPIFKKAVPRAS